MTYEKAMQEIANARSEGRPAYLRGANLGDAYLRGANLTGAYLDGAYMRYANLGGANLSRAYLNGANLSRAYLNGANLAEADLYGADLYGAYLSGANLDNANLGGLQIVARSTRSDGYEYFCWTSVLGGLVIRAGCRTWLSFADAREHCRTKTHEKYRAEALRIIDYLEVCYDATI